MMQQVAAHNIIQVQWLLLELGIKQIQLLRLSHGDNKLQQLQVRHFSVLQAPLLSLELPIKMH